MMPYPRAPFVAYRNDGAAFPYLRFEATDHQGEPFSFHIFHSGPPTRLAVIIQDAGCNPLFETKAKGEYDDPDAILTAPLIEPRLTYLVVERTFTAPPVTIPQAQRGAAQGCSTEFLERDTLEFRLQQIEAAIEAARAMPFVAPGPVLALGRREGAMLALMLARQSDLVTHVAMIDGTNSPYFWLYANDRLQELAPSDPSFMQALEVYRIALPALNGREDSIQDTIFYATHRKITSMLRNARMQEHEPQNVRFFIEDAFNLPLPTQPQILFHQHLLSQGIGSTLFLHPTPKLKRGDPGYNDEAITDYSRIYDWFLNSP